MKYIILTMVVWIISMVTNYAVVRMFGGYMIDPPVSLFMSAMAVVFVALDELRMKK